MIQAVKFSLIFVLLTLAGCNDVKKGEGVGKYGMMADNTPEYTAVMFTTSIYKDKTLDKALSMSSERMTRLLQNYRTNRNVQRHIFNLKYDTVEINPDGGDSVGRSEFAKNASVTLFLTGYYFDDKIDELRTLKLIKENGNWKVDKVVADHFL